MTFDLQHEITMYLLQFHKTICAHAQYVQCVRACVHLLDFFGHKNANGIDGAHRVIRIFTVVGMVIATGTGVTHWYDETNVLLGDGFDEDEAPDASTIVAGVIGTRMRPSSIGLVLPHLIPCLVIPVRAEYVSVGII